MKRTDKCVTPEQLKELQDLVDQAQRTPVIVLAHHYNDLRDESSLAWEKVHKRCYEMALAAGLPEIEGFYGLDNEGYFITA
jgi:hypothetical protein